MQSSTEAIRRSQRLARFAGALAAGIVAVYSAFLFWLALQCAIWLLSGKPYAYDVPLVQARADFAQGLITSLSLGWLLSVLARGLYRLQMWAWAFSSVATTCIALFYLVNCLQFRWFTLWLVPIPIMLTLLLLSHAAFVEKRR